MNTHPGDEHDTMTGQGMLVEAPGSAPRSPDINGNAREVLDIPLYLHLPSQGLRQTHLLVHVALRTNEEGTVVRAIAHCDEISPPFARPSTYIVTYTVPGATIYVPDDILSSPVYIIVEKLRGIRLKKRMVVQLAFIEWLPGDHSTFEVIADIKLVDEPMEAATQHLYIADVFPGGAV